MGYIIIIGAWFLAIDTYILNQVDLYGTMYYPLMNMFRTESYGFLFGVFLAIPVFIILSLLYWTINKIWTKHQRKIERVVVLSLELLCNYSAVGYYPVVLAIFAFAGQQEVVVTHEALATRIYHLV